MSPTPGQRRWLSRPLLWAAPVAVVLALALVVAALRFDWIGDPVTAQAARKPIGADVEVTGAKVPAGLKATIITNAKTPLGDAQAAALSPMVDVTPSGPLPSPITLRFKLNRTVAAGAYVFAASSDQPDVWDYQQATVEPGGEYAAIERTHLTRIWFFEINFDGWFKDIIEQMIGAFTDEVTTEAKKPACQNEKAASADGYKVQSNGKAALYWCFGIENGKRTLKITNRMRYPLEVDHPGFTVASPGAMQADLGQIARLFSGKETILFPFDTAVYTTDLKVDEGAKISTAYSGMAQNFHRLDVALSTLIALASKLGKGDISDRSREFWREMDRILEKRECLNSVAKGYGDIGGMMVNCFDSKALKRLFDWRGVLLAPFVAAGTLFNWLRGELNSLSDQLNSRSKHVVLVRRTKPEPPNPFIGTWKVHGSTVVFKANRTGTITGNEGPCNYTHMCSSYSNLTWKLEGNDKLIYTVTSYEEKDETGTPAFDIGTAGDVVGTKYTVAVTAPGLLKRTAHDEYWQPSNPYLCGKAISEANQAKCGA